jgi:hemoglobin-like flavoprotein
MDTDLLKRTWAEVVGRHGDAAVGHFYSRLFLLAPDVRPLFAADMRTQRAKLAATINLVVRAADNLDAVVPRLRRLGEDHRGYGAVAAHYPAVARALLQTLEYYLGDAWTDEAAGRHATTIADLAEQHARRAENDLERVTGMA